MPWPEELFADRRVDEALGTLENARKLYLLSGTKTGKKKAIRLSELMEELKQNERN